MNTPTKTRGVGAGKAADLTYWEGAARMIAAVSKSSKIVVEKSTVPVKTAEAIEKVEKALIDVINNAEPWSKHRIHYAQAVIFCRPENPTRS